MNDGSKHGQYAMYQPIHASYQYELTQYFDVNVVSLFVSENSVKYARIGHTNENIGQYD